MSGVDVVYEGLPVAKGAVLREEEGLAFVEVTAPMPVGTRVSVDGRAARVERIKEGVGAGMSLHWLAAVTTADASPSAPAAVEEEATEADEPAADEPAAAAPAAATPEPPTTAGTSGRRKKRRR